MLYLYSIVSDISTKELITAMLLETLVIITGFTASLVPFPYFIPFLAFSCCAFYVVIATIHRMITLAICQVSPDDDRYRRALAGARLFMTLTWVAIPGVWFLAYFHAISPLMEETLYQFFDFATKAGLSCMILHSSIQTHSARQTEAMRVALSEARRKTIDALRDAAVAKERFFAAVSHELRTPLNGIIGLADGVIEGCFGEVPTALYQSI
jgi:signal transduction histidine kinase